MLFLTAPVARRSHGFWRKVLPGAGVGGKLVFHISCSRCSSLRGHRVVLLFKANSRFFQRPGLSRPVRISGVPFLSLVCQLTFTLRSGAFKIPTSSHFCRSRRGTADQMCLLRKKKRPGHICPCHCFQGEGQFSICWPAASSSSSARGDTVPLS